MGLQFVFHCVLAGTSGRLHRFVGTGRLQDCMQLHDAQGGLARSNTKECMRYNKHAKDDNLTHDEEKR